VNISYKRGADRGPTHDDALSKIPVAHPAGVNSITVDRFEGR